MKVKLLRLSILVPLLIFFLVRMGYLHVSEISSERVENVSDVLTEGDMIKVKLIGFDRGKMKLSKESNRRIAIILSE